jgi:hypothetical protein
LTLLNPELRAIVVDERTEIAQADDCDLSVAHLDQDRCSLGPCGRGDRDQCFLVVDIERTHCVVLCTRAPRETSDSRDARPPFD